MAHIISGRRLPASGLSFGLLLSVGLTPFFSGSVYAEDRPAVPAAPPSQRDVALSRVAKAQAVLGNRAAAVQTASMIDDDRVLSGTLSEFPTRSTGGQPAGPGAQGGSLADFDPLIDLIMTTVGPPEIWTDQGGPGTISSFEGGVHVDATGTLKPAMKQDRSGGLADLRNAAIQEGANNDVRQTSKLRKVSLTRLERQVALRAALGQSPTAEMQTLAGLNRVQYVLVYPEQNEIILAGPAADYRPDAEGRLVSTDSGRPVLRLEDFVVLLRHTFGHRDPKFGCSIVPRQASLAEVQAFLNATGKQPLQPGQRGAWLKALRTKLGQQDIEVKGIDPRTRVARVMVEADYRMKLVGMGLEAGVPGVPSYLSMVNLAAGQAPPPMDVLRWWFALNYDAVAASPEGDAFELRGQGVKVLSETELLTELGERVHTGKSNPLTEAFAKNFTEHFAALAAKYPVYADLQNICDLAVIAALFRQENLPEKANWHLLHFGDPAKFGVALGPAPKAVDTVMNHRIIRDVQIVVGVSGGVRVDPKSLVAAKAIVTDNGGALKAQRVDGAPKQDLARERWWWD